MADGERYRALLAELVELDGGAEPSPPARAGADPLAQTDRDARQRDRDARELSQRLELLQDRLRRLARRTTTVADQAGAARSWSPPADVEELRRALAGIEADLATAERSADWLDRNRPLVQGPQVRPPAGRTTLTPSPHPAAAEPSDAQGGGKRSSAWPKVAIIVLVLVLAVICVLSFR